MFSVSPRVTTKKIPIQTHKRYWIRKQSMSLQWNIRQQRKWDKKATRQKIVNNMAIVGPFLSIISLNFNGINSSVKRQWCPGQVAPLVGSSSHAPRGCGPIPGWGMCLGSRFDPWSGHVGEYGGVGGNWSMFSSIPLSFSLSL